MEGLRNPAPQSHDRVFLALGVRRAEVIALANQMMMEFVAQQAVFQLVFGNVKRIGSLFIEHVARLALAIDVAGTAGDQVDGQIRAVTVG